MRKFKLLTYFIVLLFTPLILKSQNGNENLPMYGEVNKTKEEIGADNDFINESVELYGTREKAFSTFVDVGWKNIIENKPDIAIQKFNRAWLLFPENADPYFGFCIALTLQNKKKESDNIFEKAVRFDKNKKSVIKYYLRASDYAGRQNDTISLINYLKKSVEIDSTNLNVYKKLAYYTSVKELYEDALKAYSGMIRITPNDSSFYNSRGNLFLKIKKYNEAIVDFSKAISICMMNYPSAYLGRGRSKFEAGDYTGSIADYLECLKTDSKNALAMRLMGVSKIMLYDQKGACEAWKKAKKLGDKESEELYNTKCN